MEVDLESGAPTQSKAEQDRTKAESSEVGQRLEYSPEWSQSKLGSRSLEVSALEQGSNGANLQEDQRAQPQD